jgi:predicted dehydrogenase
MTNVLIVGLGSIARKHLKALRSINPNISIYALRSKDSASPEEGVFNVYDLESLPVKVDFAIISNPTSLHYKYIRLLMAKSIALFIEKPPLNSLLHTTELENEIADANIINYVACNLRFHPCIQYLKDFLTQNPLKRINEVNIYCGSYLPEWRLDSNFRDSYSAVAAMGGGVHLDLFHELDYSHWIFGDPVEVSCVKRHVSTLDIDAIDYANYLLTYKDFAASIILNYFRRDSKRTIEILFEEETWNVDLLKCQITSSKGTVLFNEESFTIGDTYKNQMEYFIDCLRENRMPMNTFAESLKTLKTCLCNE